MLTLYSWDAGIRYFKIDAWSARLRKCYILSVWDEFKVQLYKWLWNCSLRQFRRPKTTESLGKISDNSTVICTFSTPSKKELRCWNEKRGSRFSQIERTKVTDNLSIHVPRFHEHFYVKRSSISWENEKYIMRKSLNASYCLEERKDEQEAPKSGW
jgi:hypothetical protein